MEVLTLFLLLIVPIIIFMVQPEHSVRMRFGRLLFCLFLMYPVMVTLLYICNQFNAELAMLRPRIEPEGFCAVKATSNRGVFHAFLLGWSYSACYIMFWELLWRIRHRKKLASIWRGLGDDKWTLRCQWLTLIFAVPWLLFILFMVGLLTYYIIMES